MGWALLGALLALVMDADTISFPDLDQAFPGWRQAKKGLIDKGLFNAVAMVRIEVQVQNPRPAFVEECPDREHRIIYLFSRSSKRPQSQYRNYGSRKHP